MFSFFTTLLFIFVIVNSFTILSPFSLLFYFLLHYYQYHYTHHYYYHYYYRYFFVADVTVIIIIKNATNADIMTIIIIITNYFDVASIVSFPPPLPYLASHSFSFLHILPTHSSLPLPPLPFLLSLLFYSHLSLTSFLLSIILQLYPPQRLSATSCGNVQSGHLCIR